MTTDIYVPFGGEEDDDALFKAAFGEAASSPLTPEQQAACAKDDAEWEASKIGPPATLMQPLPYILRYLRTRRSDLIEDDEETGGFRPELVTMCSWFMLHEVNHCGGEADVTFINNMDIVCDYDCSTDDENRRVMAFPNTPQGREAIHLIHEWLGPNYPVWMLSVEDGQYHEVDFGASERGVDISNPMEFKNFVDDVLLRNMRPGGALQGLNIKLDR